MLQFEHHVGIHLDETAIRIVGEAPVARELRQALHVSSFKPRFSTVSIIPGIDARAAGNARSPRADWRRRRTSCRSSLQAMRAPLNLRGQLSRILPLIRVKRGADFRRQREPRRHGQPQLRHLRQVRALAAEKASSSTHRPRARPRQRNRPIASLLLTVSRRELLTRLRGRWRRSRRRGKPPLNRKPNPIQILKHFRVVTRNTLQPSRSSIAVRTASCSSSASVQWCRAVGPR